MALTARQLEEMVRWAVATPVLATERTAASRTFFGDDDPRPIHYIPDLGERSSRRRRFLGYFLFHHRLADGTTPAEQAVRARTSGSTQRELIPLVQGARYLLAVVTSTLPGHAVFLEVEHERFEVRDRDWSYQITPGSMIFSYLVPTGRRGQWLAGPGWFEWPLQAGPGIRSRLRDLQGDPITVERFLQGRLERSEGGEPPIRPPADTTLAAAVARMTAAAEEAGNQRLILSDETWADLVVRCMANPDITAFTHEILGRVGAVGEMSELNEWLGLALNIWNNTPQPDRGGKTPNELLPEEGLQPWNRSPGE